MRTLMTIAIALALAACTPTNPPPAADTAATPAATDAPNATNATDTTTAIDAAALTGYTWTLTTATDAQGKRIDALFPEGSEGLVLTFADGTASVTGGCNRMGGQFTLDAPDQLTVGPLRTTMMACAQPLMQADEAVASLLSAPVQIRISDGASPRLQLESATGETTSWIGTATAENRYGGPGETVFMEVAPQRIDCNHPMIADSQCLQVREIRYDESGIKQSPPGEWEPLYATIEGFEFQEGERKVLRLKKFTRDDAPADASSIIYVLDMVVESELVPAANAK